MTESAKQSVNVFKIRKVLRKIRNVKLVTIWMTVESRGNRCSVDEDIGNFIAPHFDQTEGNYHHPTLRNPAGDRFDDLTPTNRFFEPASCSAGLVCGS